MSPRDIMLTIAAMACYGAAFAAIRTGVDEIPPLLLTAVRYTLTFFPLCFFVRFPKDIKLLHLALFGIVQGALMYGALIVGIAWGMPAGLASLVVQLQVFFTIILAFLFMSERPIRGEIIAIVIAFIGIAIIGFEKINGAKFLPFLLIVAAGAVWATANMISKIVKLSNPLPFVVWSSAFAPLPLLAASWLAGEEPLNYMRTWPSTQVIFATLFMAWAATVFAFWTWVQMLGRYSASIVMPFGLLIPIFGFFSVAIIHGEELTKTTQLGALIVFAGLVINILAMKRALK